MSPKTIAIVIVALCVAGPAITRKALADEATPPDTAGGRYIFEKQADGFVRLDTQTGEVALCSQRAVGWACQAAPEDRAVLENEIARLRAENAALKKDIVARGLPLPAGAGPEPPTANTSRKMVNPVCACRAMPRSTAWSPLSVGSGIALSTRSIARKSRC